MSSCHVTELLEFANICMYETYYHPVRTWDPGIGFSLITVRREKNQQDATIIRLLLTFVTCFGYHYAHLQENKGPISAYGELFCNKRENTDISRDVFFVE